MGRHHSLTAYFLIPVLCFALSGPPAASAGEFVRYQEPEFFTFEELKSLSADPNADGTLLKRVDRFFRTPVISNEAYYGGAKRRVKTDPRLGPYLRIASWNIEKSFRMKDAILAFTSEEAFRFLISPFRTGEGSASYARALVQRQRLSEADIIVLQEMDIGVKRSGYVDAARELAKAVDMNYAYGTEYLEIDPVSLGAESIYYEGGEIDQEQTDYFAADPARYKGLFGCAVLSRYPIRHAEVFPLKNQPYDWYYGEEDKIGFVEHTRRLGTKVIFQNQLTREMKMGGRSYFRVDLEVPELPEKTLTIINVHLEIKCEPQGRELQMAEILSYIEDIRNPVILIGDFNSAPHDLSPTSAWRVMKRTARNPETWVAVGTNAFLPNALFVNTTRFLSNITKNLQNPLARDVPFVAPNPVKRLFEMIENFRFADGGAFDFRGDRRRSVNGKEAKLSNSNERDLKGFKTTFQVRRPIGPIIGKYRLDWVFVKSDLKEPDAKGASYRFSPHFGETLEEMNRILGIPISDHHPNVVDLPFEEPRI